MRRETRQPIISCNLIWYPKNILHLEIEKNKKASLKKRNIS